VGKIDQRLLSKKFSYVMHRTPLGSYAELIWGCLFELCNKSQFPKWSIFQCHNLDASNCSQFGNCDSEFFLVADSFYSLRNMLKRSMRRTRFFRTGLDCKFAHHLHFLIVPLYTDSQYPAQTFPTGGVGSDYGFALELLWIMSS